MGSEKRTIVVTGTHSVGKSTLCSELVRELAERTTVELIPEVARRLVARGITMNDRVDEHGIVSYIAEYLRLERSVRAPIVVSDRSVIDLLAYISVSHAPGVRDEFMELAEEIVRVEVSRVEAYVYVPIEFGLQEDGVRPAETDYQMVVDRKIQELLEKFGARVLSVSGSLESRVATVLTYLNV